MSDEENATAEGHGPNGTLSGEFLNDKTIQALMDDSLLMVLMDVPRIMDRLNAIERRLEDLERSVQYLEGEPD